ncbi:hypothetical protein TREMEDRAFT_30833, partial [Tremella mesenterica DSM 1558]|uniref:uncharacterized protein n=1 Tax=Tremella mesenterica (strain ATCC 24925 / CBS 8224 / DSM 1558 / NBRC 9311 / NRRL Y-6157 / RJB 2259-6 / UBC 559-6) TaxID=578456 RepID=UPI0003F49D32
MVGDDDPSLRNGNEEGASRAGENDNVLRPRRDDSGLRNEKHDTSPGRRKDDVSPSDPGGRKEDGDDMKRHKVMRACDVCRRKKIRCDGPMTSDSASKCAHCQDCGFECTYLEAAKRRGPLKGYVETLEQRCGRLENILKQLYPQVDFNQYVGPVPDRDHFDNSEYIETLRIMQIPPWPAVKPFTIPTSHPSIRESSSVDSSVSSPAAAAPSPSLRVLGPLPWKSYEQDPNRPPQDEEDAENHHAAQADIAKAMARLEVRDNTWRFHGKASAALLTRAIGDLKYRAGRPDLIDRIHTSKRAEYWRVPEWEIVIANETVQQVDLSIWPEPDLATSLIDAYFTHVNFHLPLLNHLIFRRQYADRLYDTNHEFAKVCLMVFANGSRFVDDDRVYWPVDSAMSEEGRERLRSDKDGTLKYSAGWNYLRALIKMGRSLMQTPTLFEFQCQVLVCAFLQGSAVPHLMWLCSGMGLRSAQELGIHVRSTLLHAHPVERALFGRAFWCLYHIDRVNCAAIGRSVALQDTDFDADYPIAVDDEYWETGDPTRDFKQPESAGVPKVTAFIHLLKLDHVIGAALRTIYAINQSPEHRADSAGKRAVVVELDSALNTWADAVPDGLRWDPTRSDQQLFEQSAIMYSHYYYCQILIHRPYLPLPKQGEHIDPQVSELGLPSLAICANAARSICNILDAVLRRGRQFGALPGRAINVSFMLPAYVAAVTRLLGVYLGNPSSQERERAITDVKRCIAAMKEMEMTWRQAGKMTDMLVELVKD